MMFYEIINSLAEEILTIFVQLKGNIRAICEISRNIMRHVIKSENSAQKTINLRRPMSGSKNRPTCTVPAEHSQARQAAEDNCKRQNNIMDIQIFKRQI